MTTMNDARPTGLDEALLRDLVPQVLQSATAELVTWNCARLDVEVQNRATGGLYRVGGTAQDKGATTSWSLVLKIVCSPASLDEGARSDPGAPRDDRSHWNDWQREVQAYQSGLLNTLKGSVVAPRCYGITERQDGTVWLWLEDIHDVYATSWPLERYGLAARHLGAWQGTYLAGRPVPDAPWLSRGWLRSWSAMLATFSPFVTDRAVWEHPLAQKAFGRPLYDAYQRLAADVDAWLDILDSLPQTLCHYDFQRPNLFARRVNGEEETVAIDWSYVGHGPVGEDAFMLVGGTLLRLGWPAKDTDALDEIVFKEYLTGLHQSGWRGDPALVRLGYCMSGAVHAGLSVPLFVLDAESHEPMEHLSQWGALACYLFDLADEARGLLVQYQGSHD